jgi:Aspartyl protease
MHAFSAGVLGLALSLPAYADSRSDVPTVTTAPAITATADLDEVIVKVPEPRFVAPTMRDRIGRIWAPVYINGKGPFRLVLDTGASRSAVTAHVASELGIPPNVQTMIVLRGVTGSAMVPMIAVERLMVGDLEIDAPHLPILLDALGGAEGVLGTEGMLDKRIFIDFKRDRITIYRSHGERAASGFMTIPVRLTDGLLMVDAIVGGIHAKAIIDTGGQGTIANVALRDALLRRRPRTGLPVDEITGATLDVQKGDRIPTPPIDLGGLRIQAKTVTAGDMFIFQHWKLTEEPAILIGMDVLGLFDTLIIDYQRRELQIRMRGTT